MIIHAVLTPILSPQNNYVHFLNVAEYSTVQMYKSLFILP